MKLLAFAVAMLVSAPVLACPNMDHDDAPAQTPRTADKDNAKKPADKAPDSATKAKAAKPADKAPPAADSAKAKPAEPKKPGDKVS